ncbi:protein GVQW3-like [Schistocerca americana]|uniref:protein GVQW3-like n=1 Tax=Schistocerca americana TaxID=7009 RepID=UPI001F50264B|nr:protein GVQW3-like [Schistocerca americana]
MTEHVEERYCIKICQKLGDSHRQTILKIQQVFGEDAMGVTQIKEWFNQFKNGHTTTKSDQHSGRPQTARSAAVVEKVQNLVMADHRLTMRKIAQEVGLTAKYTEERRLVEERNLSTLKMAIVYEY